MGVQMAAYECQWYQRSQSLKKVLQMVLMRTKEPVRMTAGKFFVISLETFADVMILFIKIYTITSLYNILPC
jgi:hypothetical protein